MIRFKSMSALIVLLLCANQMAYTQDDGDPLVLGEYRTVTSSILGQDRNILVHLPEGYEESKKAFPVIYKFHGASPNFFARIVGMIDMLTERGLIPEVIFVGIKQRGHPEVIPEEICPDHYGSSCAASTFLRFCAEELIPFVDRNYRTRPYRVFMGAFECGVFGERRCRSTARGCPAGRA